MVVQQQFQLSYFGTIPFDTSSELPIHEREFLFRLLREQKDSENKAKEESLKAINSIRSSSGGSAHHRRPRRR